MAGYQTASLKLTPWVATGTYVGAVCRTAKGGCPRAGIVFYKEFAPFAWISAVVLITIQSVRGQVG